MTNINFEMNSQYTRFFNILIYLISWKICTLELHKAPCYMHGYWNTRHWTHKSHNAVWVSVCVCAYFHRSNWFVYKRWTASLAWRINMVGKQFEEKYSHNNNPSNTHGTIISWLCSLDTTNRAQSFEHFDEQSQRFLFIVTMMVMVRMKRKKYWATTSATVILIWMIEDYFLRLPLVTVDNVVDSDVSEHDGRERI